MKVDYNIYGYPTTYFDGGYKVVVGAGSVPSAKSAYINAINASGNRPVQDLDLDLDVQWRGEATMQIRVKVVNNSLAAYRGTVRVFVNEIVSSLGWKDSAGKLYTFPFLDYDFVESITLLPGGTFEKTTEWDGAQHNNGYGVSFDKITFDNIMVIAGVFNNTGYLKYSYPPSTNPFTAYYVDETEGARPSALASDVTTLPEAGGTATLNLFGYERNANRNYLVLGSVSGTSPGTPLPGGMATLPLNWDVFTGLTIDLANTPVFSNFLGVLGADGNATATLNLPPVPGTAGLKMYFAYALNNPWDVVSNPVTIEIVP
jgi:hypothetical protein